MELLIPQIKKIFAIVAIVALLWIQPTFAALVVNNGNFSDTSGMTNAGGGWYHGNPNSWSANGTNQYVIHNNVLNLDHVGTFTQNLGTVINGGEKITATFDYGDMWSGGYYAVNEDMVTAELWDTTANTLIATKTVKNTAAYGVMSTTSFSNSTPATVGNTIEIRFTWLAGTGVTPGNAAALDNVSLSTSDWVAPVITLVWTTPVAVEVGSVYTDAGATASDNVDGDRTANIITVNPVNANLVGTYTVTYDVVDTVGNVATQVTRTVNVVDTTKPVISLVGSPTVSVNFGATYTDAGATASDNVDGNITGSIVTVNPVNTGTLGTYTVTYNITDSHGNIADQVTRSVTVVDITAPVITITGANPMDIEVGSAYTELGAVADDDVDADFAATPSGSVDTNTLGTYTITYNATDSSTNAAIAVTRTVNVVDTTDPVLTLLGITPTNAEWTQVYTDAGATAADNHYGDITFSIIVVNPVNTLVIGNYTITYDVTDASGNAATQITRTVNVVDTVAPIVSSLSAVPAVVTATITFNTSEGATAVINYGETSTYDMVGTVTSVADTSHDITLTGLNACGQRYHYSLIVTDTHGNVTTTPDEVFIMHCGATITTPGSGFSPPLPEPEPTTPSTTSGTTSGTTTGGAETTGSTSGTTITTETQTTGGTTTGGTTGGTTTWGTETTTSSTTTGGTSGTTSSTQTTGDTTPTNPTTPVNPNRPTPEPNQTTPTNNETTTGGTTTGGTTTGGTTGGTFNPAESTLDTGGGVTPEEEIQTVEPTPIETTPVDVGGWVVPEENSYTLTWVLLALLGLLNGWYFFVYKKPGIN